MFSSKVMRKMIQELSVPTLVTLVSETLEGVEELNEETVLGMEMIAAEMRRRVSGEPVKKPGKRKATQADDEAAASTEDLSSSSTPNLSPNLSAHI